jgi:hypothetical protein
VVAEERSQDLNVTESRAIRSAKSRLPRPSTTLPQPPSRKKKERQIHLKAVKLTVL